MTITKDIPAGNYHFKRDSTNKLFFLTYTWPTDSKYHLILAKNFAEDSAGRKTAEDRHHPLPHQEGYRVWGGQGPDIQLRSFRKSLSFYCAAGCHQITPIPSKMARIPGPAFRTGEYELRVLYDTNGNGIWMPDGSLASTGSLSGWSPSKETHRQSQLGQRHGCHLVVMGNRHLLLPLQYAISSDLLESAVNEFAKLPGIGKKNGPATGAAFAEDGPFHGAGVWRDPDPDATGDQVLVSAVTM